MADANLTAETAALARVVEAVEPLDDTARSRVFELAAEMLSVRLRGPARGARGKRAASRRLSVEGRAAISGAAKRRWEKHREQRASQNATEQESATPTSAGSEAAQ